MYHSFGTPSHTTPSWQNKKYKQKKSCDMENNWVIKHEEKKLKEKAGTKPSSSSSSCQHSRTAQQREAHSSSCETDSTAKQREPSSCSCETESTAQHTSLLLLLLKEKRRRSNGQRLLLLFWPANGFFFYKRTDRLSLLLFSPADPLSTTHFHSTLTSHSL